MAQSTIFSFNNQQENMMATRIVGKVPLEALEELVDMEQERREQEQQWALEELDFADDDFPQSVYEVDQQQHVMDVFRREKGREPKNYDEAEMYFYYGDEDLDGSSFAFALDDGYPAFANADEC